MDMNEDGSDSSDLDQDIDLGERTQAGTLARSEIYALRGEIISVVNDIEAMIDDFILVFLGHEEEPTRSFVWTSLLARLMLAAKIEIADEISDYLGVKELLRPLMGELRQANTIRAEQAHSTVGPNLKALQNLTEFGNDPDLWYSSTRISRRGRTVTVIDKEKLHEDCDFVKKVSWHLYGLFFAIKAPPGEANERVKEWLEGSANQ